MRLIKLFLLAAAMVTALLGCATTSQPTSDIHRVVIQVSTDDPRAQSVALESAVRLKQSLPTGKVEIEIVAYGPGLTLLTRQSRQARYVASMVKDEAFKFSACAESMNQVKRKRGKLPRLIDGVKVVPAGVSRIVELQEQGYSYIRP